MIGGLWAEATVVACQVAWPHVRAWWRRHRDLWLLVLVFAVLLAVALSGCAPTRTVYVDRPGPERIVERKVYVAIPAALTAPLPIATGTLPQCPIVARDRRAQLELGNGRFEAISKIQGQPAEPVATP
jgi:hypothetical protein